jgi:ketosteroid isomerase-like protein
LDRIAAELAPGFRETSRRKIVGLDVDRDQFLAAYRMTFDTFSPRLTSEVLATRGDRLALVRVLIGFANRNVGPSEIESLVVMEVDDHGQRIANVTFDPADVDAACAELDQRYAAGEAAPYGNARAGLRDLSRALAVRDWDAVTARFDRDFVLEDHRPLGWGTLDRAANVASLKALADLAPDARFRVDHGWVSEHGALAVVVLLGTREGGAFEEPRVVVYENDAWGKRIREDLYTLDQLDEAWARFAELRPDPLRIPPNAATRACDRVHEGGEAQDWDALRALFAPTLAFDDRRRGLRTSGDLELYLASTQYILSRRTRAARTLLATSGDRLALHRNLWTGAEDRPVFEIETLSLTEVDAEGRIVARIVFDPDDRRAAAREMLERAARSDVARRVPAACWELRRALFDRDLARCRAALPDDFVFHDHRRTGIGRLECADDYVPWFAALFEQSPDAIYETMYTVARARHGLLGVMRLFGTLAEGGPFESVYVHLGQFEGDRFVGTELFELEDLDVARARFEALRPDPMRIPSNAACRVRDRMFEAVKAGAFPMLRALASSDFTFEDRRKRSMLTGDLELYIENAEFMRSQPHLRITRELLGTAGDRLAFERLAQAGGPDGGEFEIDIITLVEVDAAGRLVAVINWDPDDRLAASDEAHARFVAGEAASAPPHATILALDRALTRRDWLAFRRCLADDLVYRDHRRLGLGTLGCDALGAAVRAHVDLAPDLRTEKPRLLGWNRHGYVTVMHQYGTIPDGGPFENVFLRMIVADGDRIRQFETFDVADADQALARFEELCADPARERGPADESRRGRGSW